MSYLSVAVGGALGAVGRYALSLVAVRTDFPVMTFITNIIGALLIGFIAGLVEGQHEVPPDAVLFWKTGVCGGFTTFSTFSLDAVGLMERELYLTCGLYMFLSVLCCVLGASIGKRAAFLIQ